MISFEDILNNLPDGSLRPKYKERDFAIPEKILKDIREDSWTQKFQICRVSSVPESYKDYKKECIIDLSMVVGTFKGEFEDGDVNLKTVYKKNAHKMGTIDNYDSKENFKAFLISDFSGGLPQVVECNGEYYIDGDGNHRLMLAKLLKISEAKVIVQTLTEEGEKFLRKEL
ncbi:hypothetical protein ABVR74_02895 [Lactococcus lactis subsp. lactis]|uniref:hypothetical protein n=1 Tax=Lactococcus lactis TaxID=1358 RepID=UPI00338D4ED3